MKKPFPKRRIFLILAIALAGWFMVLAVSIWSFGNEEHAQPSDCAIVLGAAVYGERPSPVFEERIKHAVTLYQAGTVSKIIFTGGFGKGASHAESIVGAAYAFREGVPPSAVLTETKSQTTRENLVEAKALMAEASLHSAILVSDPLHLKRSALMARDLGIPAVASPTPTSRYRSWKSKLGFLVREIYFYHHYQVTGN
jgi:uncharacterized SAM-binding protein YcdF (DUF218 family)